MRTLRLYMALANTGLRSQLEYRANCGMLIAVGLIWQGTGFVFLWIILSQFHNLGGWTLGELAFLYGFRLIIHALNMLIFGIFQRMEFLVRSGNFDLFLTRPVPILIQVMTYRFPIAAFGDLLGGLLIFIAASTHVSIHWSASTITYLVLAIIGGCLVEGAIKLTVSSLAFRTLSIFYLVSFFDDAMSLTGNYPLTIYSSTVRFLFTFVFPVAFLAYLPVTLILHRTGELSISPLFAVFAPLAGCLLFTLSYLLFEHEVRRYKSSGN